MREQIEKALSMPGQPVKRGTMAHEHELYLALTESAAHLRDVEALGRHTPQLEMLAVRDGHALYLAVAQRAWGIVHYLSGNYPEAEARFMAALEAFGKLDTRAQLGRTHLAMAEMGLTRSDQTTARAHLQQALAAFEALGAAPDAGRTRELLAALPAA